MNAVLSTLESTLGHFRDHQRETQRVHEQFTQSQGEYFKIFFELTQQQAGLLASQTLANGTADALNQSMLRFHEYQSETLRMHEQFMRTQTEVAQSLLDIVRQQFAGLNGMALTPSPSPSGRGESNGAIAAAPVIQAPKPAPVVQAPAPVKVEAPKPAPVVQAPAPFVKQPEPVAAAPTPIAAPAPVAPPPVPVAAPVAIAPKIEQAPPAAPAVNGAELAALSAAMLRIVGDKTGYPAEMLELSMDMEADLGIDSIKRVEILGAMRDEFPALPQFSPEELGELRTLQQIVDYMSVRSGGSQALTPSPSPSGRGESNAASAPVVNGNGAHPAINGTNGHAPLTPDPSPSQAGRGESNGVVAASPVAAEPKNEQASPADGAQMAALSDAMLRIVGDKTGYPAEMLELSMDMEADLGIDSIKRVEILGAMRDEFPTLPQFSPEELGELRTLQQIVDYMEEAGRRDPSPFELSGAAASTAAPHIEMPVVPFDTRGIMRSPVELRRLPAPDSLEYAVHGAACVVTDDGTPTTAKVTLMLQAQGWNVIVIGLPGTTPNPALNMTAPVQLADWSEASIESTLAAINAQHGAIGAYVQLTPALSSGALFAEGDKALVKFAFLMAKHLKARLAQGNGTGRKCFVTVTRLDGALGTDADSGGTITGGLFGLIKTLNLEWDGVFCRAIDIAPDATAEDVAAHVAAEMRDPNRLLTEVAYGAHGRVTLVTKQPTTNGAR